MILTLLQGDMSHKLQVVRSQVVVDNSTIAEG